MSNCILYTMQLCQALFGMKGPGVVKCRGCQIPQLCQRRWSGILKCMETNHKQRSILYFFNTRALFSGRILDANDHKHYALQVCFSRDVPFVLRSKSRKFQTCGAVIRSNLSHQLVGNHGVQTVILMDPVFFHPYRPGCRVLHQWKPVRAVIVQKRA